MKRSALNIAWAMFGILAISATLITLGKRESSIDPRIDSFGPSGLSLFAELLKANGYIVVSTSYPLPKLSPHDIPVACVFPSERGIPSDDLGGVFKLISSFVNGGGHVLYLPLGYSFDQVKMEAVKTQNTVVGSKSIVTMRRDAIGMPPDNFVVDGADTVPIWTAPETAKLGVAFLTRTGKGTMASVSDGFIACNRHIVEPGNANLLIGMVRSIAPPGSRLVFAEATFSKSKPGLIDLLGPGAAGIWYQSIFLFVVIVATLGVRFGLPEESRPQQTGQRELVEAIADTYRRARSTRVACRAAYDRADAEVRKALKLSAESPASARDVRIPPELAAEFRRTFEGTIDSISVQDAFSRCRSLTRQVRTFLKRT